MFLPFILYGLGLNLLGLLGALLFCFFLLRLFTFLRVVFAMVLLALL